MTVRPHATMNSVNLNRADSRITLTATAVAAILLAACAAVPPKPDGAAEAGAN
jgi:hypothetical protein